MSDERVLLGTNLYLNNNYAKHTPLSTIRNDIASYPRSTGFFCS